MSDRRPPGQKIQLDTLRSLEDVQAAIDILQDRINKLIDGYDGLPSTHGSTHSADQSDPLDPPGTPSDVVINEPADASDGPAYAYEGHQHGIDLGLDTEGDLLSHDGTSYVTVSQGAAADGDVLTKDSGAIGGMSWQPTGAAAADPEEEALDYYKLFQATVGQYAASVVVARDFY